MSSISSNCKLEEHLNLESLAQGVTSMEDWVNQPNDQSHNDQQQNAEARERLEPSDDRREFLRSLGKWSTAAIAAIVIESSPSNAESGWVNRRRSWADKSSRLEMAQQPRGRRQLG